MDNLERQEEKKESIAERSKEEKGFMELFEEKIRQEAKENTELRNSTESEKPQQREMNIEKKNEFLEFDPLEALIPRFDSSKFELIAENLLAREFEKYNINQIHEHQNFEDSKFEGKRSDFLITDANGNEVGVGECKAYTGYLGTSTIDNAFEQVMNTARQIEGIEHVGLVFINETENSTLVKLSVEEMEKMGKEGFREYVRERVNLNKALGNIEGIF